MRLIVALISSALVVAPALAQTSGGVVTGSAAELSENRDTAENNAGNTAENAADASAPAAERRICRRVEAGSGSRVPIRRVCRTAEQWRDAQRGD